MRACINGIRWLFAAFIGTIVTRTAIIVTINQLVLAEEFDLFGDQQERIEELDSSASPF